MCEKQTLFFIEAENFDFNSALNNKLSILSSPRRRGSKAELIETTVLRIKNRHVDSNFAVDPRLKVQHSWKILSRRG